MTDVPSAQDFSTTVPIEHGEYIRHDDEDLPEIRLEVERGARTTDLSLPGAGKR